jgi:hypothetical protein
MKDNIRGFLDKPRRSRDVVDESESFVGVLFVAAAQPHQVHQERADLARIEFGETHLPAAGDHVHLLAERGTPLVV